jgi:hypothetical protein
VAGQGQADRNLGAGIKLILEELRDLRVEMRADRQRADGEQRQAREEQRQGNERMERLIQDFRADSARRELATQRAFRDVRTVGLSIVKTLNHHTRILERIDRKLGALGNGRPWPGNGGARPRR